MMRILEKSEINALKVKEKKLEVDEGMKLAKTVDNLRKTKSEEEANLRKFREESLKTIQAEIDALIVQRDSFKKLLADLEIKRKELESPIDLTQARREVELNRKETENLKRELLDRETQISIKEIALIDLDKRQNEVIRKEKDVEAHLSQSTINYERTEAIRSQMEQRKNEFETSAKARVQELLEKEQELISREFTVNELKDAITKDKKEILERGTSLIERESTIEAKTGEILEREEKVKEMEALTNRYGIEAKKNYDLTETVKLDILKEKENSEREITNRFRTLAEKERDFSYKEHDLLLVREKIENDKKEIETEKIHIASQQESLRNAWNQIKKLQK